MNPNRQQHHVCTAIQYSTDRKTCVWTIVCGITMNLPGFPTLKLFTWKKDGLVRLVEETTGVQILSGPSIPYCRKSLAKLLSWLTGDKLMKDCRIMADAASVGPKPIVEIVNRYRV